MTTVLHVSIETMYSLREATVSHTNPMNEEAPLTDEGDLSTLSDYCGVPENRHVKQPVTRPRGLL